MLTAALLIVCFLYGAVMRLSDTLCRECYEEQGDFYCNSCLANPGRGSIWEICSVRLHHVSLMSDGSFSPAYTIKEME